MAETLGAYVVDLATATTAGGVVAVANPEGVPLIITGVYVYTSTVATAAATIDVGVAANATTSADNLIDGLDVNAATGAFDNITDKGTNGKSRKVWGTTQYVTASQSSGAVAGMVGKLYIRYLRTPSTS